jgi:hypothetical protein
MICVEFFAEGNPYAQEDNPRRRGRENRLPDLLYLGEPLKRQ